MSRNKSNPQCELGILPTRNCNFTCVINALRVSTLYREYLNYLAYRHVSVLSGIRKATAPIAETNFYTAKDPYFAAGTILISSVSTL